MPMPGFPFLIGSWTVRIAISVSSSNLTRIPDPRDNFERTMAVNVNGVLFCYKYAAIEMIKQGRGGRILGTN